MSDFLTRVSEAALGVSRAAKPLVASRYAPGPREPVLYLETVVDQSTVGGLVSAAKSNESADRRAALNEVVNAHEQTWESETRVEDRVGSSETRGMESVNALPAHAATAWQQEPSETVQPVEHITEQKEVSVPTPPDDRMSVNAKVSFRPTAVAVPESASKPEGQLTSSLIAPLSVRSITIEAAETQTATDAKAVGETEAGKRPSSPSIAPADRPNVDDGTRDVVVEDKLDVAVSEVVRAGDDRQRPLKRVNEAAVVPTRSDEVSRTDPERHLDQSSSSLRDEWNAPDSSARRSLTARAISETAHIADRGAKDGPSIIRVTIGRIDVRAVTPPLPPVQPTAPAQPTLSLEEYLRQHKGRRS